LGFLLIVDLHSHSTASDGVLSPLALVQRAEQQGVTLMAITDHDSMDGYLQVRGQYESESLRLIPGVEFSCLWSKALIHVLGLNVDSEHPILREGLAMQQAARVTRAQVIADRLSKLGFDGSLEYVTQLVGDGQIGRPHFAEFLVKQGHVDSMDQAFKRYLGAGKPGDVKQHWPALVKVIEWIKASGGVAVLAHPLHYKMTATKLRALLTDFSEAGGDAIEVINGRQTKDNTQYLAQLAEKYNLMSSVGSDFHRPATYSCELGMAGELPKNCVPVWTAFN
jgi:predicted metal-dependent phosphoesterase TrpH